MARLLASGLSDEELGGLFQLRKPQIEGRMQADRHRLLELSSRLRTLSLGTPAPSADILVRPLPAQWIASRRESLKPGQSFAALFDEVEEYIAAQAARAEASPLCIYHDTGQGGSDVDIEAAVPLARRIASGRGVAVRQLQAEPRVACLTYIGPYEHGAALLGGVLTWSARHAYRIGGPWREVYHRFNADELAHLALPAAFLTDSEAEFVTELQVPLQGHAERGGAHALPTVG